MIFEGKNYVNGYHVCNKLSTNQILYSLHKCNALLDCLLQYLNFRSGQLAIVCAKDVNDLNKDRKLVQTVVTDGPV